MQPDRSIFAADFADAARMHRHLARVRRFERIDRLFHVREALRYRALAHKMKGSR